MEKVTICTNWDGSGYYPIEYVNRLYRACLRNTDRAIDFVLYAGPEAKGKIDGLNANIRVLLDACPILVLYGVDDWRPVDDFVHHNDCRDNKRRVVEKAKLYGERATILSMPSVDAARLVPDGSLDFVFIDADHSAASVQADVEAWLPKVRPCGYVTGHDWDWPSVRDGVNAVLTGVVPGTAENDFVWTWEKV